MFDKSTVKVAGFLSCATKSDFMRVLTKSPDCLIISVSMLKVPFLLGRKHTRLKSAWRIRVCYIFRHLNLKNVREYEIIFSLSVIRGRVKKICLTNQP